MHVQNHFAGTVQFWFWAPCCQNSACRWMIFWRSYDDGKECDAGKVLRHLHSFIRQLFDVGCSLVKHVKMLGVEPMQNLKCWPHNCFSIISNISSNEVLAMVSMSLFHLQAVFYQAFISYEHTRPQNVTLWRLGGINDHALKSFSNISTLN